MPLFGIIPRVCVRGHSRQRLHPIQARPLSRGNPSREESESCWKSHHCASSQRANGTLLGKNSSIQSKSKGFPASCNQLAYLFVSASVRQVVSNSNFISNRLLFWRLSPRHLIESSRWPYPNGPHVKHLVLLRTLSRPFPTRQRQLLCSSHS